MKYLIFAILILSLNSCKTKTSTPSALTKDKSTSSINSTTTIDTVIIEDVKDAIEVTQSHEAPEMLRAIKPTYSMDMIDGEVEGSVKLRMLIGTDGLVKKYLVLNDLGYGTNKAIHNAILKTTFTSAKKDGKRIPVWIETTLNFKLPNLNL